MRRTNSVETRQQLILQPANTTFGYQINLSTWEQHGRAKGSAESEGHEVPGYDLF